jgi:ribonuclease P protein subunit POP4
MITEKNLVRHEFIGLNVKVVKSRNKNLIGLVGRVIDETMQTIKIEDDGEKIIPKKGSVFRFTLPNGQRVDVIGDIILARPEDRIKKKFRKW